MHDASMHLPDLWTEWPWHRVAGREHLPTWAEPDAALLQVEVLPLSVELFVGDVYQFSTLHDALGEANVLFIATGSRPALDPFGPFTIDYEARALCITLQLSITCCPIKDKADQSKMLYFCKMPLNTLSPACPDGACCPALTCKGLCCCQVSGIGGRPSGF